MASMRKLSQRMLRWRRYAEKTGWYPCWTSMVAYKPAPGWNRALAERQREWARRNPSWRDGALDPWAALDIKVVDGRREAWIVVAAMGGYVCAEPEASKPDGICGMPVESEPCDIHHPEASHA